MLTLPLRAALVLLFNLLLLPRNLLRLLRRRAAWVTVRLDGPIAERPPRRRFLFRRAGGVSVAALQELAREAARDRNVLGVVLEIEALHVGWARLESLRAAVAALRAAGKRVVAHLSSPGNKELYLAWACDEVLADESGPLALTGLLVESGFYGEALRRLGVDPELDRIGEYKSFADTLTRSDMAPPHREMLEAILDGLERRFLGALAAGRGVTPERARTLVDGGPYLPHAAVAAGLLDGVLYRDELPARLAGGATPRRGRRRIMHARLCDMRARSSSRATSGRGRAG
jgi:protease-4